MCNGLFSWMTTEPGTGECVHDLNYYVSCVGIMLG